MTVSADAIDLRRLVERAGQLGAPPTTKSAHPLGYGIPRKKTYKLLDGRVPLPTRGVGLEHLRDQIGGPILSLEEELLPSAWGNLLGSPELLVPLHVPSREQLLLSGIVIPESVEMERLRHVGLSTVLSPVPLSIDDGYISKQRIAGVARLVVQLAEKQPSMAEDAWISARWMYSTRELAQQLEQLYADTTPLVRRQSRQTKTTLVVAESHEGIVTEPVSAAIEQAAAVFGQALTIIRQATTTYGDVLQAIRTFSPRFMIVVAGAGSATKALVDAHSDTSTAARSGVVDRTDHASIVDAVRGTLADFMNVSAALHPVGVAPKPLQRERPAMPVGDAGECLHDESDRSYVEDKVSGLWWTRDTAHHAQTVFKTYYLADGKLHHEACRAADGSVIGKWKSEAGKVISRSSLHACSSRPHLR